MINPYAPPADESPHAREEAFGLAPVGARIAAQALNVAVFALTFALTFVVIAGVNGIYAGITGRHVQIGDAFVAVALSASTLVGVAPSLITQAICDQSIGKRILKIRIVTQQGRPVSAWVALARALVVVMSLVFCLPVGLVNLAFLFASDRRALHDHIARTFVVRAPRGLAGQRGQQRPNAGEHGEAYFPGF